MRIREICWKPMLTWPGALCRWGGPQLCFDFSEWCSVFINGPIRSIRCKREGRGDCALPPVSPAQWDWRREGGLAGVITLCHLPTPGPSLPPSHQHSPQIKQQTLNIKQSKTTQRRIFSIMQLNKSLSIVWSYYVSTSQIFWEILIKYTSLI